MAADRKTALVVSAHSADFVWRAGGAIATAAGRGTAVTVVCLSYGERGESAKLWRQSGMTLERVKAERRAEAEAAAQRLGVADIQFWDLGDYPIALEQPALFRLVDLYRSVRPEFVLTHAAEDPYNQDHPAVSAFAQQARVIAQAHGHNPTSPCSARRRCCCSSRTRASSATGSRTCCSTSPRPGRPSGRRSSAWWAGAPVGGTTPASPSSAAPRPAAIPPGPLPTRKATSPCFRAWPIACREAQCSASFASGNPSSVSSSHIAFRAAKAQAKPRPRIQVKYHMRALPSVVACASRA